ncbi:MAG TPA: hypothetical protein VHM91_25070, partial [Verrucomicrobiales bacterium]|nr:hypothetical protein [Verrucomicrobiales bacterium]
MTHPTFRTPPLLIHALAAALLCPVAFAKPKSDPKRQPQPETVKKSSTAKPQPAKQTEAEKAAVVKAAVAAGKAASQKNSPAPVAGAPSQKAGDKSGRATGAPRDPQFALIADPVELLSRVPVSGPLGEEHLILLAIANSPLLEKCRAQIASAR